MASWIGNVFDRRTAIGIALVLCLAAAVSAGAAIYSVSQRADNETQICNAVQGVRNDMVSSFKKIEIRALSQAKNPQQIDLIKEVYEKDLIAGISDPKCP